MNRSQDVAQDLGPIGRNLGQRAPRLRLVRPQVVAQGGRWGDAGSLKIDHGVKAHEAIGATVEVAVATQRMIRCLTWLLLALATVAVIVVGMLAGCTARFT